MGRNRSPIAHSVPDPVASVGCGLRCLFRFSIGRLFGTTRTFGLWRYATTLVIRANGLVPSRRGPPSLDDQARLLQELDNVESSAAWVETSAPLQGRNETRAVRVFGAYGDYRRELDADLVAGRWLTTEELGGLTRVCLVGATLADFLGEERGQAARLVGMSSP